MTKDLVKRLWAVASEEAKKYGFDYASDCQRHTRGMISKGVSRMKKLGVDENDKLITQAEQNIRNFVSEMVKEAKRLNFTQLHNDTFIAAKTSLSKIGPFY